MARKTNEKNQSSNQNKGNMKVKGPSSDSQALRTKSMDEIMGIEALDFGLGIGEILTPKASLQHLQNQSEIRHTFNEWLLSIHDQSGKSVHHEAGGGSRRSGNLPILQPYPDVDNNSCDDVNENVELPVLSGV